MSDELPDIERDDDEVLRRLAEALRRPGPVDRALDARLDGFEARVMAAIAAPDDERRDADRRPWLLRPRTVRVRPLSALATAAALLIALVGGARLLQTRSVGTAAPTTAPAIAAAPVAAPRDTVRLVQFVYLAPNAARVELVGDFNGWQGAATPLHRTPSGLWAVELPLSPGRYTYTFVVDGRDFRPDPSAPRALVDDFGTPSSVVTVGGGNT